MSRVDSARIAARKAEDAAKTAGLDTPLTKGSVVASDAFFPFADGLLSAIEAGATAVMLLTSGVHLVSSSAGWWWASRRPAWS